MDESARSDLTAVAGLVRFFYKQLTELSVDEDIFVVAPRWTPVSILPATLFTYREFHLRASCRSRDTNDDRWFLQR